MIGLTSIGTYIPKGRISNFSRAESFDTNEEFIRDKIGILETSIKSEDEDTSDLAVKAFKDLRRKTTFDITEIEVLILVTQNPDSNIPHTSAIVHKKLELSEDCAAFDISLGCSGFVYGLSIIKSFMESNGFRNGVLITSDPYSKIIDEGDKNTSFLFGDGASASLLTDNPIYEIGKFTFGTIGKEGHNLICEDSKLFMNGRSIFNFAAKYVPKDIEVLLEKNNCNINSIDRVVFHQGSKYIIDTLIRRTGFREEIVLNDILHYGNTVSSSIPIILSKLINDKQQRKILICGFGVGLSWSSNILFRKSNN